jgi:hypothetical protein
MVMSLNLKSFEACIEKIADGMALDEAMKRMARGDPEEGSRDKS